MLEITIKSCKKEYYDDNKCEFVNFSLDHDCKITLEHSLVSISKWESKWHKPFLIKDPKKNEELLDYIRCMIITQNVPNDIVYFLSDDDIKKINEYIGDPMTATTFHTNNNPKENNTTRKREIITSELIYYWMIENNIPPEYQRWHLNRLLTLIRVCSIKNSSGNKMSKRDVLAQNKSLNQARKASRGVK